MAVLRHRKYTNIQIFLEYCQKAEQFWKLKKRLQFYVFVLPSISSIRGTQSNIYKMKPCSQRKRDSEKNTEVKGKRHGRQWRMSTRERERDSEDKMGITQNAARQLRVSSHWGSWRLKHGVRIWLVRGCMGQAHTINVTVKWNKTRQPLSLEADAITEAQKNHCIVLFHITMR